ncbi:NAD(P)-dependent oxidoreductase [Tistrella mobilis]|uniref:NAD(P)-dependent oxidoreductase n=1 Tax=Tistrella mobilis TaxID=171437 RepID=UPI00355801E8
MAGRPSVLLPRHRDFRSDDMTDRRVAVIGLGNMGAAMAATLARAGFAVTGYDPAPDAEARAGAAGIALAASPAAAFAAAEIAVLSLPMAAHVEAVLAGEGGLLVAADLTGRLVIDTTTSEPAVTRRLAAALAAAGHALVDAPVSGGPAGAAAGTLTMMVGGAAADIDRARPVLEALSAKISLCGAVGAGHVVKLVNNLLCAAHLLTVSEAVRMGVAAGVDAETLVGALNAGSGRAGVSEVNFPRWILSGSFDSGFTMGLMRKDVRLAEALAAETGQAMPLLEVAGRLWRESAAGLADGEDFNRIAALD